MHKSEEEIIDNIAEIFSVEKSQVEQDYIFFVKDMLNNQILVER